MTYTSVGHSFFSKTLKYPGEGPTTGIGGTSDAGDSEALSATMFSFLMFWVEVSRVHYSIVLHCATMT